MYRWSECGSGSGAGKSASRCPRSASVRVRVSHTAPSADRLRPERSGVDADLAIAGSSSVAAISRSRRTGVLHRSPPRSVAVQPAWAMVELRGDRIELLRARTAEILTLGQVLTQQPLSVLIGAAFPGAVRVAKVDRHASGGGEGLVLRHLSDAIPRQCAPQRWWDANQTADQMWRDLSGFDPVGQRDNQHVPAGALY